MITKKLKITTVCYRVDGGPDQGIQFYGETNRHQYLRKLMRKYPGQDIEVLDTTYEEKNYEITEELFMEVATLKN